VFLVYSKRSHLCLIFQLYHFSFSPENTEILRSLGLVHLKTGNTAHAFEHLGNALAFDPTDSQTILGACSIIQDCGDYDVALVKYRVSAGELGIQEVEAGLLSCRSVEGLLLVTACYFYIMSSHPRVSRALEQHWHVLLRQGQNYCGNGTVGRFCRVPLALFSQIVLLHLVPPGDLLLEKSHLHGPL
jgi:hypothetical protein